MAEQTKTRTSATVVLGGEEFTIYAAPMRLARRWRATFNEPLQTIIGVMQNAGDIELNNMQDAAGLLQQVGGLLLNSVDLLVESLFAYSPELQEQKDWILDNATDEEALAAVWGVVKLAYPFGGLIANLQNGQRMIGTSKNSHGQNGGRKR